jgi:hypothetical protein
MCSVAGPWFISSTAVSFSGEVDSGFQNCCHAGVPSVPDTAAPLRTSTRAALWSNTLPEKPA